MTNEQFKEVTDIGDSIQQELHSIVEGIYNHPKYDNKKMTYQDAYNTAVIYKLSQLVYRIEQLETRIERCLEIQL